MRWAVVPLSVLVGCLVGSQSASSTEPNLPLHQRIDQVVGQSPMGSDSFIAGDDEFLRRIYLDLIGTIPNGSEAKRFLDDDSNNKRSALINRLLDDPRFPHHMADTFDVMLMERRRDKHVPGDQWRAYLVQSFRQNKPLDLLAREILGADGVDEKLRPAVKFYLDREGEINLLTRDVGRVFFGMDLQCAQCHDHPNIASYYQSDYYGIFAFLNRGVVFTDPKDNKKVFFAEKAEGEAKFTSVFTGEEGATGPRLPSGSPITEPVFDEDERYLVKPEKNVRPVPKYSRRAKLAELATSGGNSQFNRNLANRLWTHMMGRGLVDPVDLHHDDNPPSHPELLNVLAEQLAETRFDARAFLREVALSKTYQRSFHVPANFHPSVNELRQRIAALRSERDDLAQKTKTVRDQHEQGENQRNDARDALVAAEPQLKVAQAAAESAKQEHATALAEVVANQHVFAEMQNALPVIRKAIDDIVAARAELPEEEVLGETLQLYQQRLSALLEQTSQIGRVLEESESNVERIANVLKTAQEKLAKAQRRKTQTVHKVSLAENAVNRSRQLLQDLSDARRQLDDNISSAEILLAYSTTKSTLDKSVTRFVSLTREIADGSQARRRLQIRIPWLENQVAQLRQRVHSEEERLATLQATLTASSQSHASFAGALQAARKVHKQMPGNQSLKRAYQQIQARHDELTVQRNRVIDEVATQSLRHENLDRDLRETKDELQRAQRQLKSLRQSLPDQMTRYEAFARNIGENTRQHDAARQELVSEWTDQLTLRRPRAQTPEQLAWSVMTALGVVERQRAAVVTELDKPQEAKDQKKNEDNKNQATSGSSDNEPAKVASQVLRADQIEQLVRDKLKGQVQQFVRLFSAGPAQPPGNFFATVDQALYFANGGQVGGWIKPSGDNVVARAMKLDDPKSVAEHIYLTVLTRRPLEQERLDIAQYLSDAGDKQAALEEIVWALLTSAEFRFNR